ALAAPTRHPSSRALAAAAARLPSPSVVFAEISEQPGAGLEARAGDTIYRLGRADWALAADAATNDKEHEASVALSRNGTLAATFDFDSRLRADTRAAVQALRTTGLGVEIVSGDRDAPVRDLAAMLGVPYLARVSPGGKAAHAAALASAGHRALMVGDGLNDAPALAAAHASMAPASAADVGRNAADLVFLRESLLAVPQAIRIARNAAHLVRQNLWLAVVYNAIAVPIAIFGYVTPLVAAIAMSLSSILVMANALRLKSEGPVARLGGQPSRLATVSPRNMTPGPFQADMHR
ncbi:MAG: HAD-IC family P-type ATPase, partial [Variibacter sp.]